jgi:hypothetical protein
MNIIKYFTKSGDEKVSEMFTPYVWQEHGFNTVLNEYLLNHDFGTDLKLLLVEYYVEGKFDVNGPVYPKVSNYSKKDKSISVAFTVSKIVFHDRNEFERREFIIDSTKKAVELVRDKLLKKRLNIDFEKLLNEIKPVINKYLIAEKKYLSL